MKKITLLLFALYIGKYVYGQSNITLKLNYKNIGSAGFSGNEAYVEVENNAVAVSIIKPTKIVLKNVSFEDSLKLTIYGGNLLNNPRTFTLFPKANEEYEINIKNHWMIGPVAILTKGKQGIDSMALAKKFNLTSYVDEKKTKLQEQNNSHKLNINQSGITYKDETTTVKLNTNKLKAEKDIDSTKKVGIEVNKSGNVKVSGKVDNVSAEISKNQANISYTTDSTALKTSISKQGISLEARKDSVSTGIDINNQLTIRTSDNQQQNQITIDKENIQISSQNKANNSESTLKYSKDKSLNWEFYQKTADDSIRTNWIKKGGTIFNKSTTFELINITMLDSTNLKGWGFGVTDYTNLHNLRIKNINKTSLIWGNISYGYLENYTMFFFSNNQQFSILNDTYRTKLFVLSQAIMLSGRLTYNLGITTNNSLISKLKGVMISLSYEPTLMMGISAVLVDMYKNNEVEPFYFYGDANGFANINPLSWRIDFDFIDLSSFMYRQLPKAGLKLSLKVYPHFGNNKFIFTMFSIGWSNYVRPANKYLRNPL